MLLFFHSLFTYESIFKDSRYIGYNIKDSKCLYHPSSLDAGGEQAVLDARVRSVYLSLSIAAFP